MKIITSAKEMQSIALRRQIQGRSIGFVPTMGALHEGHLSLVRRARKENDTVVVSIYVNPLQFGPKEDFKHYPRSLAEDKKLLLAEGVDFLFAPSEKEMVPEGYCTIIDVPRPAAPLDGPFRPGHYQGVATVVAKLFQIAQPTRAYFGQKDYQQVIVIMQMVRDLQIPVRIVVCPTLREADGLAMSSRNRYLSKKEREEAVKLYQTLFLGREIVELRAMKKPQQLLSRLRGVIQTIPSVKIDYIELVDPVTLAPLKKVQRPALLAAAIRIGQTRLIDNVLIS